MDIKQLHESAEALCKKTRELRARSEQLRLSAHTRCQELDAYLRDVQVGRRHAERRLFELLHRSIQHEITQADHVKMRDKVTQMFLDAEHMQRKVAQQLKKFYAE